jgi:hypothetical protein
MTDLEKYQAVNACETIKELQACILTFGGESGMIQGRTRIFNANEMAINAELYYLGDGYYPPPNVLTREFGIRQQAMYLHFYKPDEDS